MFRHFRNRNFFLIVSADLLLFMLALLSAYLLRFDFKLTDRMLSQVAAQLVLIAPFKLIVFYAFGLYRGMWRYFGIEDMWRLTKAIAFSSLVIFFAILLVTGFKGFSRSVFILDGTLTFREEIPGKERTLV